MNWNTIKTLIWKEWRETRWRWSIYFLTFNLLTIVFVVCTVIDGIFPRFFDFLGPDPEVMRFTEMLWTLVLFEIWFLMVVGQVLVAFSAANAVAPELRNRSLYFLFERPISRQLIMLVKFAIGAFEIVISVATAPLILMALIFFLLQIFPVENENIIPASNTELWEVAISVMRAGIWLGVLSLFVYTLSFMLSIVFTRQLFSASISVIVILTVYFAQMYLAKPSFRAFYTLNLQRETLGNLSPPTLIGLLVGTIILYSIANFMFVRKEFK